VETYVSAGPDHAQCARAHEAHHIGRPTTRAGLTIVPVVPWEGPRRQGAPDQLQFFYHAVMTSKR